MESETEPPRFFVGKSALRWLSEPTRLSVGLGGSKKEKVRKWEKGRRFTIKEKVPGVPRGRLWYVF